MRKGIMFSFIMFFLATTVVALILLQRSLITHKREQLYIETRVESMNNMYDSILRDLGKISEIIMRRAISASVSHVVTEGVGLDDAILRLEELALNGTLNETGIPLMENTTFPEWIEKIEVVGVLKGFDINIILQNFEVKPYDSWNLLALIDVSINITDQQGVASLSRSTEIDKLVYLGGLEDPLYPLKTGGLGNNTIVASPYKDYTILLTNGDGSKTGWRDGTSILINSIDAGSAGTVLNPEGKILVTDDINPFNTGVVNGFKGLASESDISLGITIPYVVNVTNAMDLIPNSTIILVDTDEDKIWDIENLKEHVGKSRYHSSSIGASFLDRLEGELEVQAKYSSQTDKTIGLESFIDKNYFLSVGIQVDTEQTNIDYHYFSDSSITGDKVKGLSTLLRIDDRPSLGSTHQEIYGVSDLTIS